MERAYCDALRTAYEFEKSGEQLYRSQLDKVTDEFAKKILEFLADEETEHIRKIEEFNDALLGTGKFDIDRECSTDISERARQLVRNRAIKEEEKINPSSIDIDIYDVAMDMEKESYGVFKQALADSKHLDDERIERFFSFILDEEKVHYDLLAASKKYLEDPAYYFLDYGGWVFS
jgi:rubrerythrin